MNDKLAEHRKALLLLHLLLAPGRKMRKAEANRRLTSAQQKKLDMKVTAANQVREELARDGFLDKTHEKTGRAAADYYRLTDRGFALLGTLEQYPTLDVRMKGKVFNELIVVVRAEAHSWQGPAATAAPEPPLPPERLAEGILAEFEELRRERFGHTGLVPIHEVRRRVAGKYGPEAARHDVFDAQVQQLRQQRRVRLVPISDLRDATPEQLNDAIPGVNETLFYLEPVREQLVLQ